MSQSALFARLFLALSLSLGACLAGAYYDDVHYALTYYMARESGLSPLQAYRVASADSMVDWDPRTEPVQSTNQAWLVFSPFKGSAQDPRWKFHAMRNEEVYSNVLGSSPGGADAEAGVLAQRQVLWQSALTEDKNPGVFLHSFQDEMPHHGYGSAWGHWPMEPGCVQEYKDAGLSIGGSTDWVSTRPSDVLFMCEQVNGYLTKFINQVSPHQYARPFYENEFSSLIHQLALVNPAPAPIDSELKRQIYIQYYAKSFGISQGYWGSLVDPTVLSGMASQLGIALSPADLAKQKNGPSLESAIKVIDKALKAHGMNDTVPLHHQHYTYDSNGHLADESERDNWVLVGSMQFEFKAKAPTTIEVRTKVHDRQGMQKEMDIAGFQPVKLQPGATYRYDDMPIGDLILHFTRDDGSTVDRTLTLNKQVNVYSPVEIDQGGISGDWLWERVGKDANGKEKKELVPAYLTGQDDTDTQFNGVYFPYLTLDNLVRTPDQSPTHIEFHHQSGAVYTIKWEYPGGPSGTGTMTLSGNEMSGEWIQTNNGLKGTWTWIRPNPEQLATLTKFFGR